MTGQQHRSSRRGLRAHELTHPPHALGIETVHRLIQDQGLRVAEECRRDAEALPHTERELPGAALRDALESGDLDDLVHPADIVGKRIRYFTDGSKLLKVHLSVRDRVLLEAKLQAFSAVYAALTNKKVAFEFA
jgi:hypothetical protein